jgi:hypothetical protein
LTGRFDAYTQFRIVIGIHRGDGERKLRRTLDSSLTSSGPHGSASHETPFDQLVRVVTHDLTVFASARFAFVSVDHKVLRPAREINRKIDGILSIRYSKKRRGLSIVVSKLGNHIHHYARTCHQKACS